MSNLFFQANALTRAIEKGFVVDNGGPTNLGITIPFLTDYWRLKGNMGIPTEKDIRALTPAIADDAFENLVWNRLKCGFMPAGVGYAVFDAAVNSGVPQAAIWLQTILGVKTDGVIGQNTLQAIFATDPIGIIKELSKARSRLMLNLNNANEEKYERGWHSRLIDVTANAILINLGKMKA